MSEVYKRLCSACSHIGHYRNNKRFHPYCGVKLNKYIRTKKYTGVNERNDVIYIIDHINTNTEIGINIKELYASTFPDSKLISAKPVKTSNRNTNTDFEIVVSKNGILANYSVEHKGSIKYKKHPNVSTPWEIGVQFLNCPINKYTIGTKYGKLWYDTYIKSMKLTNKFKIKSLIPNFEDWFKFDAKVQGNPKTNFGKELKNKVKRIRGNSLLEERKVVNDLFEMTSTEMELFKKEVMKLQKESLHKKHYWINIHGDINKKCCIKWYPQYSIAPIKEVIMTKEKDILFKFICEDDYRFNGILRWGKGAGFSNLRIDLK